MIIQLGFCLSCGAELEIGGALCSGCLPKPDDWDEIKAAVDAVILDSNTQPLHLLVTKGS